MKTIITIIFLFTFSALQAQVTQEWVSTYHDPFNQNAIAGYIAVDGSGNIYVTGYTEGLGNYYGITTIKYGPSGGQQWTAQYPSGLIGTADSRGIGIDNSGNVYVTGYNITSTDWGFITIKYNSSGAQQWVRTFVWPGYQAAGATAIAVDGSGNVHVTGYLTNTNWSETDDWATLKYNTNGDLQWVRFYSYSDELNDLPYDVAVDNSGNVYVTGYSGDPWGTPRYETIKYNSSGVQQWEAHYSFLASNPDDAAYSIAVDGNGNSYVTGSSKGTDSHHHCATVKYNSSGAQQWAQRYNGTGTENDAGNRIIFKDGFIYVGGVTSTTTSRDYLTIKYNPSGSQLWAATYDGPAGGYDHVLDIAADDYGDVYVTGESRGNDGFNHIATVRYNPNGTQQWVQRYNSGSCSGHMGEGGTGIVIGPSGNVLVTGYVTHIDGNCNKWDYCTIKYTQTGLGITPVSGNIPDKYSLEQNYPNPFNPATSINFSIPKAGNVRLTVYDILGKEIALLVDENLTAGTYKADFDASNFSSGTYFYRIEADGFTDVKKMILIK
jgi:hypothetical protein